MTTQEQHSPEQQKSVTSTVVVLPCRIFYSTQSGRAKAGARRTARILHDHGTRASTHPPPPAAPGQDPPMIQLQNGHGTTFEAFEEFINRHHDEAVPTNFNSNTHTTSTSTSTTTTTSPIEQFVHHMKQSGTAVLLCFISTTGDGEHTVRTLVYTVI